MEGTAFAEAKIKFKGVRVDKLRAQILARYNNSISRICGDCRNIYNNGDLTTKLTYCYICDTKICPTCVPNVANPPNGYVPICGICRDSYAHDRKREAIVVNKDHENDKSVSEESFLDVTIKSKGSSTPKKTGSSKETQSNKVNDQKKKDAVCSHYLKGRCKHRRIGTDCKWSHPKLCFSFVKSGAFSKEECNYYHPNLCKHSKKKEVCPNEVKCRYYHIKICRKKKESTDGDKKDEDVEKDLREKIGKEIKDKELKEKKEKEIREKIMEEMKNNKENINSENPKEINPPQDFQKSSVKAPDIMSILLALQTQVSELQAEAKERREREKYQSQYQAWYPAQYQQ